MSNTYLILTLPQELGVLKGRHMDINIIGYRDIQIYRKLRYYTNYLLKEDCFKHFPKSYDLDCERE